jgi:hypothetical protein
VKPAFDGMPLIAPGHRQGASRARRRGRLGAWRAVIWRLLLVIEDGPVFGPCDQGTGGGWVAKAGRLALVQGPREGGAQEAGGGWGMVRWIGWQRSLSPLPIGCTERVGKNHTGSGQQMSA